MPNWCNNILTIQNPSTELAEYLKTEGFSFDKIKPTPPEMLDDENHSWYGWRVDNWGTKWDIDEEFMDVSEYANDKEICFGFDTAWSPPMGVIEALSEKFPEDHFLLQYLEMGVGFGGEARFSDGSCVDSEFGDDGEEYAKFAEEVFGHEPYEDDE